MNKKIHEGRNIKRFREILGVEPERLAQILGDEWNEQKIYLLEQKETIESILLRQISAALNIPIEAIQTFDEDLPLNIIANTFNNNSTLNIVNSNPSFHAVDKLLQSHEEKILLYEKILKGKDAATESQLYNQISLLSPDLQQELTDFVAFLKQKAREDYSSLKQREPGIAKGLITMSPDFDEPLEDFKDYM